jgi:hypothetical protein
VRLKVEIDFPNDFYVDTLTRTETQRLIRGRLQDAVDNEFPVAPIGTVSVVSVVVTDFINRRLPLHDSCVICRNEGRHPASRPHVMDGQE